MTYQCHNREPFCERRIVQDGRFDYSLTPKIVSIANFSEGEPCRYTSSDLGRTDGGCRDCVHKAAPALADTEQAATY
jgi:hypothetical protein